jgi:unsaturated rhamnogalacturonyl hydrolase
VDSAAELLIVPPHDERDIVDEFVAKCLIAGVHFYAERGDRLPSRVPPGLESLRAIVIEHDQVPENAEQIARYERAGVCVYRMNRHFSPAVPNTTLAWTGALSFQAIAFDAVLALNNPSAQAAMQERDDDQLLNALGERVLASENVRWYDATRYQWEALLGVYDVTRDRRFLDTAERQILHAINTVPNELSNCDTVAPIVPILQLYLVTKDGRLLDYATTAFDRYLREAPRYRGCLLNFRSYPRSVRSEILWQVLPGLVLLSQVTGDPTYADAAADQYRRLHELLYNPAAGLWSHGNRDGRRSAGYWARGVAIGFFGDLLVLETLSPDSPIYAQCRDAFFAGARRLRELQDPSGFWFAVPDNPSSGRESSSAAWLCAAFERALRQGLLGDEYRPVAERAWRAVKSRIWNGGYPGHMTGTTVSLQPEYYLRTPLAEKGWAHFPLRAMVERRRTAQALARQRVDRK